MSAKEANKKSVIHIEMFPDDILSEILRHTTWVPYGIDPSDMVEKRLQSSHSRDIARRYRASLVTRRYLVRVCKTWHHLAILYLYEWILVARLKNLEGIVHILERQLFGSAKTCIGWCTMRLDIDFRWTGGETLEELSQEGQLVLRLLPAVPNLRVLTFGTCSSNSWARSSVSHTYCPKLQFFNSTSEKGIFEPEDWTHFVQSHPNLIATNISIMGDRPCEVTTDLLPPPHALRELTIEFTSPVTISVTFTSLTRLTIDVSTMHLLLTNSHWRQSLITPSLPSLTSLQLNFTDETHHLGAELEAVEHLLQYFPNVCRIYLALLAWPRAWFRCALPSSVSIFGLRVCSAKPSKQAVKRLLTILNYVVQDASSPLQVQFLDNRTMQYVCIHEDHLVRDANGDLLRSWLDPNGDVYRLPIW